ncbi:substrate-binding domain-containing protein [Acidipila sp. EB88]|uniref:substrate-binding domain-containing protein n=1 Tax=Acidipila sp. EB88 TaxID=2305226 RepID=UPI000F5ED7F2|nr:substrate-binding domain-containing protein [Acidipila sp. EB88]RRA47600.1 hypothetical protein D1Y84_04135 [Acidipila sp. EB88]
MISFNSSRRVFLGNFAWSMAGLSLAPGTLYAQNPAPSEGKDAAGSLSVASAGSFRAMLEGPLKLAAAQWLHLELGSHTEGADAVAHALINGSLSADLFVSITASPVVTVLRAGRAEMAYPVARTELVLICSPKSRFAAQFEQARQGHGNWWELLQTPGLRIARSNPSADPSGRAFLFALMIAAKKYNVPNLVETVLGSPLNPAQVLPGAMGRPCLRAGTWM